MIDGLTAANAPPARSAASAIQAARLNPEIQAATRQGLVFDVRTVRVGVKPLRVFRAGAPFNSTGLELRPLAPRGAQTGLRFLKQLVQPERALLAINGGFFNRVRQLPLGAVRVDGTWLSGPILNRGALGWARGPRRPYPRLRLAQGPPVRGGRRWGLGLLNSGYVQRGLSRYTRAWGPVYRALSGEEKAITVRDGTVTDLHERAELVRGVPLSPGSSLIVSRAGAPLPAQPGDRVSITLRSSSPVGDQPHVLAGGPLLLKNGQVVLQGRKEGFSQGFLALSAPRTVVAQDRKRVWLLTIPGTPTSGAFYAELEDWIFTNYSGDYATVRVEWSKGWGYTASGPWTNTNVIGELVPASLRSGRPDDADWDTAMAVFERLDPHDIFRNPFLDRLMPRA